MVIQSISIHIIDFEAKGNKAIDQEMKILYATPSGTMPLDPEFGLNWSILDKPIHIAKQLLVAEIIRKTKKYLPAVKILRVEFEIDERQGVLIPKVVREYA